MISRWASLGQPRGGLGTEARPRATSRYELRQFARIEVASGHCDRHELGRGEVGVGRRGGQEQHDCAQLEGLLHGVHDDPEQVASGTITDEELGELEQASSVQLALAARRLGSPEPVHHMRD